MKRQRERGRRPNVGPRWLHTALLACAIAGCRDDTLTIRGRMLPGSDATDVYVVGQPVRSAVEEDSFVVTGVEGEVIELEFTEGDSRLGRMRIETAPASELILDGIWIEDGTAFVARIEGDQGGIVVNGLRLAGAETMPQRVEVDAVVLAASDEGDALLVRPALSEIPDLRVVVTPGTVIEGRPDDEDDLDLEFGDSVRVEGTSAAGYVVATRLVVKGGSYGEDGSDFDDGDRSEDGAGEDRRETGESGREDRDDGEGPRSLVRPGGGKGRGRGIQRPD